MAPCLIKGWGFDFLLCNVLKSTLLRLPSLLCRKWHKTWGHRVPIMVPYTPQSFSSILFLNLCSLYLSHMNLYLPRITGFIGFYFFWHWATSGRGWLSSGTGTQSSVNENTSISSASCSVQCTLNPPPPLLEGSPPSPTLPVCALLWGAASCVNLNITPFLPSKLLPLSFHPPLPHQLLCLSGYWNTILYSHTDDRVSQETNHNSLQKYEPFLMM